MGASAAEVKLAEFIFLRLRHTLGNSMARTFWLGFRGLDERLPVTGATSSSCCSFSIRSMLP